MRSECIGIYGIYVDGAAIAVFQVFNFLQAVLVDLFVNHKTLVRLEDHRCRHRGGHVIRWSFEGHPQPPPYRAN